MTDKALWIKFKNENKIADDVEFIESFHFELTEKLANELLALVLDGTKKATSSSIYAYGKEGEGIPKIGDYSIVTDWSGNAKCIIKTTNVRLIPYKDLTFDIIKSEGEDDSLDSWQKGHAAYFEADGKDLGYEFTEDMPVVFENFEVVYRADTE